MSTAKSVLIVDDSLVARMMVSGYIVQLCPDWRILEARDGADALQQVASAQPGLVILDVNMPGMNGFEVAEKIMALSPGSKIAFLTGNIQDSSKARAGDLGHAFVEKPVTLESFAKLKAIMDT